MQREVYFKRSINTNNQQRSGNNQYNERPFNRAQENSMNIKFDDRIEYCVTKVVKKFIQNSSVNFQLSGRGEAIPRVEQVLDRLEYLYQGELDFNVAYVPAVNLGGYMTNDLVAVISKRANFGARQQIGEKPQRQTENKENHCYSNQPIDRRVKQGVTRIQQEEEQYMQEMKDQAFERQPFKEKLQFPTKKISVIDIEDEFEITQFDLSKKAQEEEKVVRTVKILPQHQQTTSIVSQPEKTNMLAQPHTASVRRFFDDRLAKGDPAMELVPDRPNQKTSFFGDMQSTKRSYHQQYQGNKIYKRREPYEEEDYYNPEEQQKDYRYAPEKRGSYGSGTDYRRFENGYLEKNQSNGGGYRNTNKGYRY